jgi:hypothetical protein
MRNTLLDYYIALSDGKLHEAQLLKMAKTMTVSGDEKVVNKA